MSRGSSGGWGRRGRAEAGAARQFEAAAVGEEAKGARRRWPGAGRSGASCSTQLRGEGRHGEPWARDGGEAAVGVRWTRPRP